jgi:hypothetical protein
VERHDDSTDAVSDCAKSVSEASQNDADESAVRISSFVSDQPTGSTSSPSMDDESGSHSSLSPQTQVTTPGDTPTGPKLQWDDLLYRPSPSGSLVKQSVVALPRSNSPSKLTRGWSGRPGPTQRPATPRLVILSIIKVPADDLSGMHMYAQSSPAL